MSKRLSGFLTQFDIEVDRLEKLKRHPLRLVVEDQNRTIRLLLSQVAPSFEPFEAMVTKAVLEQQEAKVAVMADKLNRMEELL